MSRCEPVPACDYLIQVTTSSELAALRKVGGEFGLHCTGRTDERLGRYHRLHDADGALIAVAVKTAMGAVGAEGSAAFAWRFQAVTGAAYVLQIGMAFGVDPERQRPGDVLVATALIPYDQRDVVVRGGVETVEYPRALPISSSRSLLLRCEEHASVWDATWPECVVRFGALLSGGAAISSEAFRDRLRRDLQSRSSDPIIGGEMEGLGLVGVVGGEDPSWIVIKGISDFADEQRAASLAEWRTSACANAVRFALGVVCVTPAQRGVQVDHDPQVAR